MKKDKETFLGTTIILGEVFQYHPSIKRITETSKNNKKFSFEEVTEYQVRKKILHLDGFMATPAGDVPVDILKLAVGVLPRTITKIF